jgi:hypothetical protein
MAELTVRIRTSSARAHSAGAMSGELQSVLERRHRGSRVFALSMQPLAAAGGTTSPPAIHPQITAFGNSRSCPTNVWTWQANTGKESARLSSSCQPAPSRCWRGSSCLSRFSAHQGARMPTGARRSATLNRRPAIVNHPIQRRSSPAQAAPRARLQAHLRLARLRPRAVRQPRRHLRRSQSTTGNQCPG